MTINEARRGTRAGHKDAERCYQLQGLELASGLVLGHMGTPPDASRSGPHPRTVLEERLGDALTRTPCVVSFSGGRDSSALLALAVDTARQHGLPPPVPVTRRYLGDAAAEESRWQELVIRHLGLTDWIRLELRDDCDLVGSLAELVLRRFGVVWPPTVHVQIPVLEVARGGTVITGEGGDEVFGLRRVTPVRHLAGGRRRRRAAVRMLPEAVGPRWMRRWRAARRVVPLPWLTPDARQRLRCLRIAHELNEPLSWRRSTTLLATRRGWVLGAETMQQIAELFDVRLHHPLLDRAFLDAVAAHGSVLGPLTRPDGMRDLFGHVLPDDVLRRRTKATFNTTLFGQQSRAFATQWTGDGVDRELVDRDSLAAAWQRPVPDGRSFALLQSAWLAAVHREDRR